MFKVRSEAHGRVLSTVEDIKSCCEISDYYEEWSDIAASSIQAFLEDLSAEQLDDTCLTFREYISETAEKVQNLPISYCNFKHLSYFISSPYS